MWTITARRIAAVKLDSLIADTDACVIQASQENCAKQVIRLLAEDYAHVILFSSASRVTKNGEAYIN